MSKLQEENIGKKFGRLSIIGIERIKGKKPLYVCKCDCGKEIKTQWTNITTGRTISCGCLNNEQRHKKGKNHYSKHNMTGSRILRIRNGMLIRCYAKSSDSYKNYGGRGITVCEEWKNKKTGAINFINWAKESGYEEHLKRYGIKNTTIDRIDVNGNYEPSNCRWATLSEQQKNRRDRLIIT